MRRRRPERRTAITPAPPTLRGFGSRCGRPAWLERFAALDRAGQLPRGWPRPLAGARLFLDFYGVAHILSLPLSIQEAVARSVLRGHGWLAQRRR